MASFSHSSDAEFFNHEDPVLDESAWEEWDAILSGLPPNGIVKTAIPPKRHDANVIMSSPEETALEYARHVGLAKPWDTQRVFTFGDDLLLAKTLHGRSLRSKLEETMEAPGLPGISFQPISSFNIRPIVTPGSMTVLNQVLSHRMAAEEQRRAAAEATDLDLSSAPAHDMKLELPLLPRDPEANTRRIAKKVRQFRFAKLSNDGIPRCDDFGLALEAEIPDAMKRCHAEIEDGSMRDRLNMTKGAMACLAQGLKPTSWTQKQQREMMNELCGYKKYEYSSGVELVLTPPLSPLEPLKLDPETLKICTPSDLSDLEDADTRKWADMIKGKEKDLKLPSPASLDRFSNIDVSQAARQDTLSSSPRASPGVGAYLETPLLASPHTGGHSSLTPEMASVMPHHFVGAPDELTADGRLPRLGESSPTTEELYRVFHEQNTQVIRAMEQDKLDLLNAKSRLPVPLMDFSVPEPPWATHSRDPRAMIMWMRDNQPEIDWRGPAWPVDREAQKRMRWVPFKMNAESQLPFDIKIRATPEVLEELLAQKQDDEIETSVIHVNQGLSGWAYVRSLDDSEDDDEVFPASLSEENDRGGDLLTLARKRKRQLEEESEENPLRKSGKTAPDSTARSHVDSMKAGGLLCGGGQASATAMLENYMQINAPKRAKPPAFSAFFGSPKTTAVDGPRISAGAAAAAANNATAVSGAPLPRDDEASKAMPPPPRPIPVPAPEIAANLTVPGGPKLRVMAALSLSRGVATCLEELLPGISFVDRDYDAFNSSVWQPGSVSRSTIMSPLSHEADLTVCSSTGIILTPLVKLRQRAVVGAGAPCGGDRGRSRTPFQYRVERVAARYERLIILVSDSMTTNMARAGAGAKCPRREALGCLTPTDAAGLAEFQGFAAGLSTGAAATQVLYVGGGDGTLARWAAALIGRYADTEGQGTQRLLLSTETTWELFLRRAGMNAYAAQVVLAMLGMPQEDGVVAVGNRDGRVYGLPRFVGMTPDERADMFGVVMGGRKVLDRVGKGIDQRWDQIGGPL